MTVPEATMYEYYDLMSREHHIGIAWYVCSVKSVAEATLVKSAPENHFRFGVLVSDPAHDEPTLFRRQNVGGFLVRRGVRGVRLQRWSPYQANQVRRSAILLLSPQPQQARSDKATAVQYLCLSLAGSFS